MKTLYIALSLMLSVVAGSVSAQNADLQPAVASDTASGTDIASKRTRRHIDRFASKGYFGQAEFNFSIYNDNAFRGYGIDIINGYRTSPWFAVGVGVGVRYMDWDALAVPFYLHLRTDILDRKVTPYFAANIGGAYMTGMNIFVEPSCGVGIRLGKGRQVNIGCGVTTFLSFGGALGCTISAGYAW